jgi:hypothetical protein
MLKKNKTVPSGEKNIGTLFILAIVVVTAIFFGSWIRHLNEQLVDEAIDNSSRTVSEEEDENGTKNKLAENGIVYEDEELGFALILPKDGRRYAVKELASRGSNQAILFGLPITDQEVRRIKKEKYSEIFRIKLVPVADVENAKKTCANSARQFPFCDSDDRELGRNEQFVFVYTRYDKLDEVEQSKIRLIPTDFDATVFAQADEIAKSFRVVSSQLGLVGKKL